ncbi:Type IV inositol polyphosphate 5-phosphatase 7 [Dichanthelium oligosanthes]|uniref:Type IV inositol polyphosphate 5-phosphatase 7 n=1 Tax=Dichanthelium oligosanthes TaxID=888268 RepID=A0A1E5WFX7_9POAL|nr:Type IV inositol polyphosphate 5-phosphatase 7 [Dichanthelium oligosanthes]
MRDDSNKKSKLSWSKSLVRKWFNIKSKAQDFHADRDASQDRLSKRSMDRIRGGRNDFDAARLTEVQNYRIFASTWNVGGKSPPRGLNLDDWLHSSPPADIYVLGFQEIVPLNAGNVLGTEDNLPARKWVSLVRRTLNKNPGSCCYGGYRTPSPVPDPVVELDADFEGSSRRQDSLSFLHRRSFNLSQSLRVEGNHMLSHPRLDRRFSVCDPVSLGGRPSDFDGNFPFMGSPDDHCIEEDTSSGAYFSPFPYGYGASAPMEENDDQPTTSRYCLVASKQMVGIFLTIWVRSEIRNDVRNLKVSCVGRGLMGYLGNKIHHLGRGWLLQYRLLSMPFILLQGSISISMSLHHTTFCFICCHLTSGEKEGDELRRNSDVMEILRKTRFPQVRGAGDFKSPETILEHEYVSMLSFFFFLRQCSLYAYSIIWLGDLNYRIALSYCSAKALVEMHNWKQLLEKDQLRIERRCGRVFQGWKEGRIYFPPTYKYSFNSDRYSGVRPKEKRRTPAWCDRILWYGNGLMQLSYVRGESRFSDHRPVYSIFMAEVEIVRPRRRNMGYFSSRVEVEELLPYSCSSGEMKFY